MACKKKNVILLLKRQLEVCHQKKIELLMATRKETILLPFPNCNSIEKNILIEITQTDILFIEYNRAVNPFSSICPIQYLFSTRDLDRWLSHLSI